MTREVGKVVPHFLTCFNQLLSSVWGDGYPLFFLAEVTVRQNSNGHVVVGNACWDLGVVVGVRAILIGCTCSRDGGDC